MFYGNGDGYCTVKPPHPEGRSMLPREFMRWCSEPIPTPRRRQTGGFRQLLRMKLRLPSPEGDDSSGAALPRASASRHPAISIGAPTGAGGGRAEVTQGNHQKWTAITLGGPAVPDITLTERTTCMFFLDQSLGAFFTASAKYAGLVRNSAAAVVP